jgi:hypothetical protein
MENLEFSYSSTVPNPSRQQLDELDSLLQQMLGLPVQPAADEIDTVAGETVRPEPEAVATAPEPPRDSPPVSPAAVFPAPTVAEQSVPMAANGRTDCQSVPESGRIDNLSYEPAPDGIAALEQLEAQLQRKLQAPSHTPPVSRLQERIPFATERPSAWLLLLVWCNDAFDGLTRILGPLGRWLRGTTGRWLLGWTGLMLLGLALALALYDLIRWSW